MSTVLASSLTPAEVTCWTGGENNPAGQSLEMAAVDALAPGPDHETIPRRLYLRRKPFPAARGVASLPWLPLVSSGRTQEHTEECRARVEGELKKTAAGKARLLPAAVHVAGVPAERAAKSV